MNIMNDANSFGAYRGRSALITGGLGFIGSNLAHRLVEIGVKVSVLDSLLPDQGGNPYNVHDLLGLIEVHTADMRDQKAISHLVGGIDFIFNLAGSVSHLDSMQHPLYDLELNCAAHVTLLEVCRQFNPHVKVVYTSTRQVYGRPVYLPLDEQHRVAPLDVNGINKLTAEHYHLLYHRVYGTRSVCLRLTNTYGPRQLIHHNRQGFIAWFMRQAIDGGVIELFGEGRQQRDLNYVDDVVDALLLAGASEMAEGEIYNLGGDEPISLAALAEELISITGRGTARPVPFPREQQLIDVGNTYSSFAKIQAALGWQPRTPLRVGLERTVAFYQQHRAHYWKIDADQFSRSQKRA